jgi:hypothetical protein
MGINVIGHKSIHVKIALKIFLKIFTFPSLALICKEYGTHKITCDIEIYEIYLVDIFKKLTKLFENTYYNRREQ